ncbi:helix-turn-helix domain-containing protein [Streptomyces sp. NPDC048489]|uniref:helix-turn-helix domain-containing protein n=1 Tax=Streptomyces sp. NPDC048489 TaxID=3154504 RepID=UPI0034289579
MSSDENQAPQQQATDIESLLDRARLADRQHRASPADKLRTRLIAALTDFDHERRAEILAAGGNPDETGDPFETVRAIADNWAASTDDPAARTALLDDLAGRLDNGTVRALRLAGEAAAAVTPRLIYMHADTGFSTAVIASDFGVSESYVYRILRKRSAEK